MSKNDDLVRRLRVMGDETRRYRLHREYCKTAREAADAIERGAAQGVWVKQLEWKGPFKPGENGSHYDHIYADSALGRYAFEWKSWKGYDSPTSADCPGDFFYAANDLNDAKAAAQADYEQRIMSALDTATPPAPTPDAGEEDWRPVMQELVDAMRRYEVDVEADAPQRHRDMMDRADQILAAPSPTPHRADLEAEAVAYLWTNEYGKKVADVFMPSKPAGVERLYSEAVIKAKADENERLRAESANLSDMLEGCREAAKRATVSTAKAEAKVRDLNEMVLRYLSRAEAAKASNKALREGLEPFAAIAEELENEPAWAGVLEHDHPLAGRVTVADFRRARALLSETGGE